MEDYTSNETLIFQGILAALVLLALPFLMGFLRKGFLHVAASVVFLVIYIGLFGGIKVYRTLERDWEFPLEWTFVGIILGTVASALICYFRDKTKQEKDSEEFYDKRLFYKYGQEIKKDVIPLAIKDIQQKENLDDLAGKLKERLSKDIVEKFKEIPGFYNQDLQIKDARKKDDARYFIKLSFDTARNSTFSYFLNIKQLGQQIAITNFQYVRSRHEWFHALLFIVTAPFHYWFWIYHWFSNKLSIRSILGTYYYGNSFDLMDIESYLKASNFIVMHSIQEIADEFDLLTEELKQMIVNNINNTQNIQIQKSKWIRLGKLKIGSSNPK